MKPRYSKLAGAISREWAAQYDGFKYWKPKHVLRVHGPLLMGICLDSTGSPDEYEPYFHYHELVSSFDHILLSHANPLRTKGGVKDQVTLRRHAKDFEEIVNLFKAQNPAVALPGYYADYLAAAGRAVRREPGVRASALGHILRRAILTFAWSGADVAELVARAHRRLSKASSEEPAPNEWRENIQGELRQEALLEVVAREKEKRNLMKFTDYGLVFGANDRQLLEELVQ